MAKNVHNEIVNEIKDNLKNETRNNATTQLVASEKREEMAAKPQSPRDIWAKFQKDNAIAIAAKVVAKSGVSYSFDAAREVTKDFTIYFTEGEKETKSFGMVGSKSLNYRDFDPKSVDDVLRCFEQSKIYFSAVKVQANKQERAAEKKEKAINFMLKEENEEILFAAMAKALGKSVEELKAMRK